MDIHSVFIEFGIMIAYKVDSLGSWGWRSDAVIRFRGHPCMHSDQIFFSSAALVEIADSRK